MFNKLLKLLRGKYTLSLIVYRIFCTTGIPKWYLSFFRHDSFKVLGENTFELDIKTYDGLNQTIHPDVTFKDGKYYMVVSPFPFETDSYENPCLFLSYDGINFSPLPGCQPLALPRMSQNKIYLSDPAVIVANNIFAVYYREVEDLAGHQHVTRIYKVMSADLASWSEPILLLETSSSFICPAVIWRKGALEIYYVGAPRQGTQNLYRCQETANSFVNHEPLQVVGLPTGFSLWHIGIFEYHGQLFGLMTMRNVADKEDWFRRLYFAKGSDDGRDWVVTEEIRLADNQERVFTSLYKSALAVNDQNKCNLYVSAQRRCKWGTYLTTDFPLNRYMQS